MTTPLDTLRVLERRVYDFVRSLQAATEKAYEIAAEVTRLRAEAERDAGLPITRTPAAPRNPSTFAELSDAAKHTVIHRFVPREERKP